MASTDLLDALAAFASRGRSQPPVTAAPPKQMVDAYPEQRLFGVHHPMHHDTSASSVDVVDDHELYLAASRSIESPRRDEEDGLFSGEAVASDSWRNGYSERDQLPRRKLAFGAMLEPAHARRPSAAELLREQWRIPEDVPPATTEQTASLVGVEHADADAGFSAVLREVYSHVDRLRSAPLHTAASLLRNDPNVSRVADSTDAVSASRSESVVPLSTALRCSADASYVALARRLGIDDVLMQLSEREIVHETDAESILLPITTIRFRQRCIRRRELLGHPKAPFPTPLLPRDLIPRRVS